MISNGDTFVVYPMRSKPQALKFLYKEDGLWWCLTPRGAVIGFNPLSPGIRFVRATGKEKFYEENSHKTT